jgi:ubiquinone/menaquinone biosynthesis C-methylase UbiE
MIKNTDTSWQKVAPWYNRITKNGGHYYHQHVVIPGLLRLLNLQPTSRLLDLACGSGVLSQAIDKDVEYVGIDLATDLIRAAKEDKNDKHRYLVGDVTKPLNINGQFTHTVIVLSLQNIKVPTEVIKQTAEKLVSGGKLVIVLNHPCFRIPRQSGWDVDPATKQQKRWETRYMTPMEIPITAHPGQKQSPITWSYHYPLSEYTKMIKENGFLIQEIEEWTSDKQSVGKAANSENRAREEFPLFLAISATKLP